jgi:acyl transferase domain-containing protein
MGKFNQGGKLLVTEAMMLGCRLPGDVASPGDLWDLINARRTANKSTVPSTRFAIGAHYHPNNERPWSFNVPGGYFLDEDLQGFDPAIFDFSPIEAIWMDPHRRKLLEVVYEAFESSGHTLDQVSQAVTGCFFGSFTSDFQQTALKEHDFRHSYATTGIDPGILPNRVSHAFNLRGPRSAISHGGYSTLQTDDFQCPIKYSMLVFNVCASQRL